MAEIKRSALVPHRANEMYELVLDVDAYPQFLPWCRGSQVIERSEAHQLASVQIAGKLPQTEFTTRNTLHAFEGIQMNLVDGPFRQLSGSWLFKALSEDACKVELDISYEFSSTSIAGLLKPVFTSVAGTVIEAFVAEAQRRYGG